MNFKLLSYHGTDKYALYVSQKVIWNLSESRLDPLFKKKCLPDREERRELKRGMFETSYSRRNGSKLCKPDENK